MVSRRRCCCYSYCYWREWCRYRGTFGSSRLWTRCCGDKAGIERGSSSWLGCSACSAGVGGGGGGGCGCSTSFVCQLWPKGVSVWDIINPSGNRGDAAQNTASIKRNVSEVNRRGEATVDKYPILDNHDGYGDGGDDGGGGPRATEGYDRNQLATKSGLQRTNVVAFLRDLFWPQVSRHRVGRIQEMRRAYKPVWNAFLEEDLPTRNPVDLFDLWFNEVKDSGTVYETNAVAVATATSDGLPSVRMVLLKQYDEQGFVFFTNYDSRKGKELLSNPRAAMLFYWDHQHRQVRVEGRVEKISRAKSEAYFHSRPRASQISASVSKQSCVVASRKVLEAEHSALAAKYSDESTVIPCPDVWGGLILIPEYFEFWQGQTTRLHDRLIFRRPKSEQEHEVAQHGWYLERLAP